MKAVTRNPEAIGRYEKSVFYLEEKIESGEVELGEEDGTLEEESDKADVSDGYCYRFYETASGKGIWYLSKNYPNCEKALIFRGRRESFKNGSSMLGFSPRRSDGWSIVESSHPERGPFESKKHFYKRKGKEWMNKGTPEHIKIETLKGDEIYIAEAHFEDSIAVSHITLKKARVIYDERDVDLDEIRKLTNVNEEVEEQW